MIPVDGGSAEAADPSASEYYSVSGAARLLGVSRISIWRWVRAGQIPMARLGHRTTRIKRADLQRLLDERQLRLAKTKTKTTKTRAGADGEHAAPQPLPWSAVGAAEHVVQFYETDGFLLDGLGELMGLSLRAGDAGVVVASAAHCAMLLDRLAGQGVDVARATGEGRFLALDAAETLATFMVDALPSAERFAEVFGPILARASEGGRRVRVFGEMVGLLAEQGNHVAAIRLEQLWNDLQRAHAFALFCGYPMAVFGQHALGQVLDDVCAAHSRVLPTESYAALASDDDRLRAIAALQQQARSLQAEVAERQRAEDRLRLALESERAARGQAESALRLRDEFLSIASHELKTPITSLSASAQLALRRLERDGQLDPPRVEQALHTITEQAERLTRLLGQLLDISRLEGGKLSLDRQPTDVCEVVQQVVAEARLRTDRHTFEVRAPRSIQALLDPLRFEQVLVNLVDNAVKYSPGGGQIDVDVIQPDQDAVEVAVRDRGLGIPPDKRGAIFERFYQAHPNAHTGGMGLGLYITHQIVELHGGRIRAEFPADGGTRFVVALPVGLVAWTASSSPSAA